MTRETNYDNWGSKKGFFFLKNKLARQRINFVIPKNYSRPGVFSKANENRASWLQVTCLQGLNLAFGHLPTPSKVRKSLPDVTSQIVQVLSAEALAISFPSALALRADDGFACPDMECTKGPPGEVKHTLLGNKQGRHEF